MEDFCDPGVFRHEMANGTGETTTGLGLVWPTDCKSRPHKGLWLETASMRTTRGVSGFVSGRVRQSSYLGQCYRIPVGCKCHVQNIRHNPANRDGGRRNSPLPIGEAFL